MAQKRALVCEDDPSIRSLVRTIVAREGFTVDTAADGSEALNQLRDHCYELVMLDLMMPNVDGYGVVDAVRSHSPATLKRIVVMTAASEALRQEFPVPVCTMIPKPFDIDNLSTVVRECAKACASE
jgi:CheY-like chemotaxis protein